MASPFSRGMIAGFVLAVILMTIVQQLTNLNRSTTAVIEKDVQSAIWQHNLQTVKIQPQQTQELEDIAKLLEKKKQSAISFGTNDQKPLTSLRNENQYQVPISAPPEPVSGLNTNAPAPKHSVPSQISQQTTQQQGHMAVNVDRIQSQSAPIEEPTEMTLPIRPLANIDNRLQSLRSFGVGAFDKMKGVIAGVIERGSTEEETAVEASTVTTSSGHELVAPKNSNGTVYNRRFCEAKRFNKLSYLPEDRKQLPPMLYTFPGSGNTWGRLLIEHATGVYTGSVYNDQSLLDALPGEFTCDWRVSVVKVHPHTHTFADLYSGHFASDNGKCKRGGVMRFERAVLLIRNPFDSIWSEYQRRVTQSHVEGILRKTFDWSRWQANAAALSNSYNEMWGVHYRGIEEKYEPEDILYLRYEDLKSKKTRVATLKKVVDFLRIQVTGDLYTRLECAFALSESTQAHRSIDPEVDMTKDVAYTKELACRMFALFGKHVVKHNYTSWRNWDCTGYPPIAKVNVGPRGEYNRAWVRPGAQLLDFGGHEKSDFDPNAVVVKKGGGGGRGGGAGGRSAGGNRGGAGRGRGARFGPGQLGPGAEGNVGNAAGTFSHGGGAFDASKPTPVINAGGMTMREAANIPGVGSLGSNKPAWS